MTDLETTQVTLRDVADVVALVAIVAVQDLMYQAKTLATETYRPIETFTVAALIYFAVSFPVTQVVGYLERRRQALTS